MSHQVRGCQGVSLIARIFQRFWWRERARTCALSSWARVVEENRRSELLRAHMYEMLWHNGSLYLKCFVLLSKWLIDLSFSKSSYSSGNKPLVGSLGTNAWLECSICEVVIKRYKRTEVLLIGPRHRYTRLRQTNIHIYIQLVRWTQTHLYTSIHIDI